MKPLSVILFSYLLGSFSFGIVVTKIFKGKDIRNYGSGSTGMTNVLRIAGRGPAALVLIGDALKGAFSALLGNWVGGPVLAVLGGLAAMVGHTYPLYHGFKGGKGVATGLGIMLALAPDVIIIAIIIFLIGVYVSRYVSLGSILAALSVPIFMLLFNKPRPLLIFGFLGSSFVIYCHRSNIKRLYHGNELRIGRQK